MKYDKDGKCWTADHDDLFGWTIVDDLFYKIGVRRVTVERGLEQRTVYVSDPLAAIPGVGRSIERTHEAAQNAIAHMIKTQLTREFSRIRREHLRRHWITLTDTFISVYADKWSNAARIIHQTVVLRARYRKIPEWLDQLNRLQTWYCRMSDLAKVSVELELPPLPPPPVELKATPFPPLAEDD